MEAGEIDPFDLDELIHHCKRSAHKLWSFCGIDDHGHPHLHARHADGQAKVRIDQVEIIESSLDVRQLRLVLAWAELHREELLENWPRARAGETRLEIDPLR